MIAKHFQFTWSLLSGCGCMIFKFEFHFTLRALIGDLSVVSV